MSSQRITRDTFDAVVQEKMKRYRISLDQALTETIQEFQLDGPSKSLSRMQLENYRDGDRFSLPRDSLSRGWELESRRDDLARQSYMRDYGRDRSPIRVGDRLDQWRSDDPLSKERFFRDELAASSRRIHDLEALRSRERGDFLARDLDYGPRRHELERNPVRSPEFSMGRPGVYREFRSPPRLGNFEPRGSLQEAFRSPPGARGRMPMRQARGGRMQRSPGARGPGSRQFQTDKPGQSSQKTGASPANRKPEKDGETSTVKQGSEAVKKAGSPDEQNSSSKYSMQIVRWAKFHTMEVDADLAKQHRALFKVKTDACKKIVECFKGPMTSTQRERCFGAVKFLSHSALKNPKIDNELLDMLIEKQTVKNKNEFFEVIKPFDKEMMMIQQRLLKTAIPLLMACNTYELKNTILTDERQLVNALRTTVFLCRKSMVLLGQTFSLATISRQNNILDALSLSGIELKPSDFPNFKDCYLFGKEFMVQLKNYLKKSGRKPILKTKALPASEVDEKDMQPEEDLECKEQKEADPAVVETIDKLLENAKSGDKEGEKPAFWFLFDKDSSEYKYYRQKLADYQRTTGQTRRNATQTRKPKRSPEDLACDSVRAMLYARKVLGIKRRTFRSIAFSNKRKQMKSGTKPPSSKPVKSEPKTEEKQEPPASEAAAATTSTTTAASSSSNSTTTTTTPAATTGSASEVKTEDKQPTVATAKPKKEETPPASAKKQPTAATAKPKKEETPPASAKKQPAVATPKPKKEETPPASAKKQPAVATAKSKKEETPPASAKKQAAVATPKPKKEDSPPASAKKQPAVATAKPKKEETPPASVKTELSTDPEEWDIDAKTKDTAVKLAQFVAQMGPEIEQVGMENSLTNPEFWFVQDKESQAYKYYKIKVEEFKRAEEAGDEEGVEMGDEEEEDEDEDEEDDEEEDDDVEGDAEDAAEAPSAADAPVAAFTQMPTPARPSMPRKRVTKLKVGMLPPKRVCLVEEPKVHDPVRIEYDRPRGRGYNRRKKPADLEFANKKLTQQNVGFQMLSKMGWKEGQGLGSDGSGIKNPIKVGSVSAGEGLGVEDRKPAAEGSDDNYDAFRQRMMQIYKQKIVK
ncbi:SURP and G-patch domain-containing protein 2 [Rhinophrynus dorsalis]